MLWPALKAGYRQVCVLACVHACVYWGRGLKDQICLSLTASITSGGTSKSLACKLSTESDVGWGRGTRP